MAVHRSADKGKQFKILKDLMHRADVSEVVNACDAGRAGELISALSIIKRAARSPLPVFGFPLWKRTQFEAALNI